MNANELAEIIQHLENARYTGASKAATMLRQQQAEIEEYEKCTSQMASRIANYYDEIKTLTAENKSLIAELQEWENDHGQ